MEEKQAAKEAEIVEMKTFIVGIGSAKIQTGEEPTAGAKVFTVEEQAIVPAKAHGLVASLDEFLPTNGWQLPDSKVEEVTNPDVNFATAFMAINLEDPNKPYRRLDIKQIIAEDYDEAKSLAEDHALRELSEGDGWRHHKVVVTSVEMHQ